MSEPRDADSVAERLRRLRSTLGLSQEQLARRLGVSFATVNRWESGRTALSARAAAAVEALEAEVAGAGDAGAGDLGSQHSEPTPGGRLPVAQSSFVGRERELAELTGLARRSRLLSLTGPGGAGKTRLAIELIGRAFADEDVVFVPLEPVRQPRTLVTALASQLGVHDQPGTPLTESLQAALADSPRLLLLDGAESMRDQVADLTGELLAGTPGLRIIVTSRVILGVTGEVCWTVPPLECPSVAADASDIASCDAVQLFVARATERVPGFRVADVAPHAVAELCRRLDGLPLAIELIAGWVGTLSIKEILQQRAVLLDSDPALAGQHRGRRLADVLRVSYDLLQPAQQRAVAMLSVFAGSFGVEDMRAVLGSDGPTAASTARLLVDSSWLEVTRGSEQNLFGMLETIRSFAALLLEETGEGPEGRRRHALHMAELASASEHELAGPDAARWTSRMFAAIDDLHAALQWALANDEVDVGLEVSAALWRWWLIVGRLAIGRMWLAQFLEAAGDRLDELTGRAYCSAAVLAAENGDYPEAVRTAEIAMRIFEPLALTDRMALAATVLGSANRYLGDMQAARRGFQTVLELRERLTDQRGMAAAINNLALLELDDGELDRARELFEEALAIKREIGEQRSIAIGLVNLADVLIRTGEWEAAGRALREAAETAADSPQLVATIRCNQGDLAARRGNWAEAAGHYQAAIASGEAGGYPHAVIEAMLGLAETRRQAGSPQEAARQLRAAQDLAAKIANPALTARVAAALTATAADAVPGPEVALPGNLTRRQAEVLGMLAAGLTNKQIAEELYLSTATVERHLATIYGKLGVGGRVEAARFAIAHGLDEQPGSASAG